MYMNGDESFKLDTFHFGQFLRGYLDQLVQHVQEKLVSFIHDLRKKTQRLMHDTSNWIYFYKTTQKALLRECPMEIYFFKKSIIRLCN